jgi:hypothetical protein
MVRPFVGGKCKQMVANPLRDAHPFVYIYEDSVRN